MLSTTTITGTGSARYTIPRNDSVQSVVVGAVSLPFTRIDGVTVLLLGPLPVGVVATVAYTLTLPIEYADIGTIAYAATINPPSGDGLVYRCVLGGPLTIGLPPASVDADRVKLWLIAAAANYTVSLHPNIVLPASSSLTFPVTINTGKKAKLLMEYDASLNGGQWELTSFINGY